MNPSTPIRLAAAVFAGCTVLMMAPQTGCPAPAAEEGFTALFNGRDLDRWMFTGVSEGSYAVEDGALVCVQGGRGNLFTERQFGDFVLRFEFRLSAEANNGIGIRAPMEGDPAYQGMEIQILDESAALAGKWGTLRPEQFHGSIYGLVPAAQGALRPPGEWNEQEITANGRRIIVVLNGVTVLETDLNTITDAAVLAKHPGLLREKGHIALLGHGDRVEFRNLRIRELSDTRPANEPPSGFVSLFNGEDLSGWKGLIGGPPKVSSLSPTERESAQKAADELMRRNWKVEDGSLVYTGTGFDNLVSAAKYADFELQADWKLMPPGGDSGIYLRGVPQVQIWAEPEGSGGLWNNKQHPNKPLKAADHPPGNWNRFRILMQGEAVTVWLNDTLVVDHVPLENYWDRGAALYSRGPIELQAHRDRVWFRNIFIREIPATSLPTR